MTQPISIALIGAGAMGKNHARVIAQICRDNPRYQLAAIVDANINTANSVAQSHSTREHTVRAYSEVALMLSQEKPEIVALCVPTKFHRSVGEMCLAAHCHLLMEKPIADTIDDARALAGAARRAQRQLMIGHIERYNPAVQRVKAFVDAGELGKIVAVQSQRVSPMPARIQDVNIAVDLAIHDLDLVPWIIGEEVRTIRATQSRVHLRHRADTAHFFLQTASANAYITANWITPLRLRTLALTGTKGYLHLDYLSQQINVWPALIDKTLADPPMADADWLVNFAPSEKYELPVTQGESLREEWRVFLSAIDSGTFISCEHAISALALALTAPYQ